MAQMINELISSLFWNGFFIAILIGVVIIVFYDFTAKRTTKFSCFLICLFLSFLIIYLPIYGVNSFFEWKVYTYDVNGDRMFSDKETTQELVYYQDVYMNQLGGVLDRIAYFLASIVSALTSVFIYFPSKWLFKKMLISTFRFFK